MTRTLSVREELNASKTAVEMYAQFKNNIPSSTDKKAYSLHAYINRFIAFKKNPTKNRKPISPDTIADYELHLTHLEYAIAENKMDSRVMKIDKLTNEVAELVFKYVSRMLPSEVTQEKYFTTYKTFCNYLIKEEKLKIDNPFIGWRFTKTEGSNEVISYQEFVKLLNAIRTKPKFKIYETGRKKKRTMYYYWLEDAIKLSLFSGARRQEIPMIKWGDIVPDRDTGELAGGVILLQDIKSTNIQQLDQVKIKPIEINEDLADFLMEIGYDTMKGSGKYIIDPQEQSERYVIKDNLSRSFGYYIKFASERNLEFGCLRKTWFTASAKKVGEVGASEMGGHSKKDITVKHYLNKLEMTGSRGKFKRIFSGENLPPLPPSKNDEFVSS